MSRLDRYYIPPGVPARPPGPPGAHSSSSAPPLPKKGILMVPPPAPPPLPPAPAPTPAPPPSQPPSIISTGAPSSLQQRYHHQQQAGIPLGTRHLPAGWAYQGAGVPPGPQQKSMLPAAVAPSSLSSSAGPHSLMIVPAEKIRPERGHARRPLLPRPGTGAAAAAGPNGARFAAVPVVPASNCYEELLHPTMLSGPRQVLDSHNLSTAMSLHMHHPPGASEAAGSPRQALQRILALYENGEHREAAAFMRRLSFPVFRQLLPQLPADIFVDSMPHSLPILEALYAKIFFGGGGGGGGVDGGLSALGRAQSLRPEAVVWQLVKFFASQDEGGPDGGGGGGGGVGGGGRKQLAGQMRWEFCGPFISSCKRLLSVLLSAEPRLKRLLSERRRSLMRAIEGLGQHGMVGTSDEQLMHLHNALKLEFERAQRAYAEGIQKLEALSLLRDKTGRSTISGKASSAPIAQSHQRQLSLKSGEIQERLIKNKTLLNVVEPTLENTSLEVLLGILQKRIDLDKECLFQYTQIRKDCVKSFGKDAKNSGSGNGNANAKSVSESVAPIFMRYQRGCQQVRESTKKKFICA